MNSLRLNCVWCEEVIIDTDKLVGTGKEGDPFRRVTRVYTKDGCLIAERDDWEEQNKVNKNQQ
jgi:hypothetical protein